MTSERGFTASAAYVGRTLAGYLNLYAAGKVDGLYFALPTRVAARELYRRVLNLIESTFPANNRPLTLLAVPGYAQADGVPALPSGNHRWTDDKTEQRRDRTWAVEAPKRFLAAPVVVGTIDQALLSTVQTSHAHLRSVCLDRHLLVVDEVHSSDEYMRSLLRDLLRHREGIGAYSLLLSATLSNAARTELLHPKGHATLPLPAAIAEAYPAIYGKSGPVPVSATVTIQKRVLVTPTPLLFDLPAVAKHIKAALDDGARVLVVLNTVKRAIATQKALENLLGTDHPALYRTNGVPGPHHGRFSPTDREHMDSQVVAFVGNGCPAGARVVVGTQTLEQSLDIDADLLITDLCPSDVLLQRIGREHRHQRTDRPAGYQIARCILLVPDSASLVEFLNKDGTISPELSAAGLDSVYDARIAEMTWCYFRTRSDITIPRDNREVIEHTMHTSATASLTDARWVAYAGKKFTDEREKKDTAAHCTIKRKRQAAFGTSDVLFDDALVALTRLGVGSILVEFQKPVISPFGASLSALVVPGQWGLEPPEAPVNVTSSGGVITFELQGKGLLYDRFGLQKT